MVRALAVVVCGIVLSSLAGCAADEETGNEEDEAVAETSEDAVRTFRFTVYAQANGAANPAEKIRGLARGYTSTNPTAVSGLNEWTVTSLDLRGLPPNTTLGAHAHVLKCDDPTQGGGHYQHVAGNIDPVTSEIWLDVKTNAQGAGSVQVLSPFKVRAGGVQSIVIHAQATDPATAKAGAKLACANLALD